VRVLTHPALDLKLSSFGIDVPLLDQRVERIAKELKIVPFDLQLLEPITQQDLLLVHAPSYVRGLFSENLAQLLSQAYEREASFRDHAHAQELFQIVLNQVSATHLALKIALEQKTASFFLGGGMHHAHFDFGHGFCVVNDIVLALEKEYQRGQFKKAWVIDTDAHFGDGTADLAARRDWLATFSIHQAQGWPIDSLSKNLTPSSLDIGVDIAEEENYLARLAQGLNQLEQERGLPEVAIVVAGADAFEGDILPSSNGLNLTLEQILERDKIVYQFLCERNIPQAWVMAGGYGSEVWRVWAQFLTWVG
jgi:acetoin utilization deacetylase AcuC-like enzyme